MNSLFWQLIFLWIIFWVLRYFWGKTIQSLKEILKQYKELKEQEKDLKQFINKRS